MKQFARFLFAGGIGFLADSAIFALLQSLIELHSARVLSFLIAVFVTFQINRRLTFNNRRAVFLKYFIGQFNGFLLNFFVFAIILGCAGRSHLVFAFVAGTAAALVFNFFYAKTVVFKA